MSIRKKLPELSRISYCFSHSINYSAVLVSSGEFLVSIDIEPKNRKISKYLSIYLSRYFPNVDLTNVQIISILECAVKLDIIDGFFDSEGGMKSLDNITISRKESMTLIRIEDKILYSVFINSNSFYACIASENSDYLNSIAYVD